jgi:hypothetical protein
MTIPSVCGVSSTCRRTLSNSAPRHVVPGPVFLKRAQLKKLSTIALQNMKWSDKTKREVGGAFLIPVDPTSMRA